MDRYRKGTDFEESDPPVFDTGDDDAAEEGAGGEEEGEDQEPFMGGKVRRKASRRREYRGDYLDVPSRPRLMKILEKQGDKTVVFADKVLKFTGSGKMKRRIFIITDFALYLIDPETDALKRRIALAAVDKLCLSKLSDNFFAIVIPTEYDLLMASTRKTEIVKVVVDVTKNASDYELEVAVSNRFEYNAAATLVKEVFFEEVEGGIKTRISKK
ncbi:PREDICTED: myosin IB heavy chain [Tarenaya hassleriana]|uniref:myosin IB heavy chain n=1 Tax=Tarenaya hassleriana TaxID=28532 RepID=UPI00053C7280|nr:PREDICTED: myosin IB heavy chain [Tarenaya hassleriana]